jgi:hypothetical protein
MGLGRQPRLQRLELAGNKLSGEMLEDLALSTSLFIDLLSNRLSGSIPASLSSCQRLVSRAEPS